jgi:hypothetical protein
MNAVELADEATPYAMAAINAYGGAVLTRTEDEAAAAPVNLGRRILRRLVNGGDEAAARLESAITELVDAVNDEDVRDTLTARIMRLLASDDELAADIRGMLTSAGETVTASGEHGVPPSLRLRAGQARRHAPHDGMGGEGLPGSRCRAGHRLTGLAPAARGGPVGASGQALTREPPLLRDSERRGGSVYEGVGQPRPSSLSKLPSSRRCLTVVRKRPASAPSTRRWS